MKILWKKFFHIFFRIVRSLSWELSVVGIWSSVDSNGSSTNVWWDMVWFIGYFKNESTHFALALITTRHFDFKSLNSEKCNFEPLKLKNTQICQIWRHSYTLYQINYVKASQNYLKERTCFWLELSTKNVTKRVTIHF